MDIVFYEDAYVSATCKEETVFFRNQILCE
jgi:hypothetical protein